MPDGITQCRAIVNTDGRLVVVVQMDGGPTFAIDRDEAVAHGLAVLNAAACLYPSAEEFTDSVDFARAQIEDMHHPPLTQLTQ